MELVCITLHKNGSFGVMFRSDGRLLCTCGWNEGDEDEDEDEDGAGAPISPRAVRLLLG